MILALLLALMQFSVNCFASNPHECVIESSVPPIPLEKLTVYPPFLTTRGFICEGLYLDKLEVAFEREEDAWIFFRATFSILNWAAEDRRGHVRIDFLDVEGRSIGYNQDPFNIPPVKEQKFGGSGASLPIKAQRSACKIKVTISLQNNSDK